MSAVSKFLTGAAGAAMLIGAAAPAAAQYNGYGRGIGDVIVGTVIDSVIGGGRYGGGYGGYGGDGGAYGGYGNYGSGYGTSGYGNERVAVDQCSRAAEQRVSGRSNSGYGDSRYGNSRYGNSGYGYAGSARVVAVTNVERRPNNSLRVKGLIDANGGYDQGRFGNSGYGSDRYGSDRYGAASTADLRFQCNIDNRGRITNLDINRNDSRYRY